MEISFRKFNFSMCRKVGKIHRLQINVRGKRCFFKFSDFHPSLVNPGDTKIAALKLTAYG